MDETFEEELARTAKELEKTMQCNCDLDRWEPERTTGHSWVCRIHKTAKSKVRRRRHLGT